ncbi:MAG: 50S ribosomal protein L9 [Treponema sp.]|jgi:large subunit ribosomal protein L9|nr:50S ribosomal protein L9 [Treponema sp.]
MKVILNKDLSTLGEEGDVKDVARGYARNYLFPRGIALPYTPQTVKLFESRKEEIEAKKVQKRQDSLGLKEKLEALEISITMPAGANGRLYGAVTSQTVADELAKLGFQIERKRIELTGNSLKSTGKYKAAVKLYESASAEIQIVVIGQALKTETPRAPARPGRRRRDEARGETAQADASGEAAAQESGGGEVQSGGGEVSSSAPAESAGLSSE